MQNFKFYFVIDWPKCILPISAVEKWITPTILIKNSDFEIFYNEKTFFDDLLNECNRDDIIPLSSHSYNYVCTKLKNRKLSPTHTYYKHLVSSSTLKIKKYLINLRFLVNRFTILKIVWMSTTTFIS